MGIGDDAPMKRGAPHASWCSGHGGPATSVLRRATAVG